MLQQLNNSKLKIAFILTLFFTNLGNAWGEEAVFLRHTGPITDGYYIIVSDGYAMNNTTSNNRLQYDAVSITNNAISADAKSAYVWKIWSQYSYFYIQNASSNQYLASTESKNQLTTTAYNLDDHTKWSITDESTYYAIENNWNKKNSINYTIRKNGNNGFACYASTTGTWTTLYKMSELKKLAITIDYSTLPTYYVGDIPTCEGLKATATDSDNSETDVTTQASWSFSPDVISKSTTSITATASYGGLTASVSFEIIPESIGNTAETAYTVDIAYQYIDNGEGLAEEVYVKGAISDVVSFDSNNGTITYSISENGETDGKQLLCQEGFNTNNEKFTSFNDLQIGSDVVVKGLLAKDGSTYKFKSGNSITAIDKSNAITLNSIEIGGEAAKTEYVPGDTPSVEGLSVTATYSNNSTKDVTDYAIWTVAPETISENTSTITATAEFGGHTTTTTYDIVVNTTEALHKLTSKSGGSSAYYAASDIQVGGVTWNVMGNTSITPWRIGGNDIEKTDRDLKTTTPVYGTVKKVDISIGNTEGNITFHKLELSVANNKSFNNASVYTLTRPTSNTTYTFDIEDATDAYYKITFNVSVSGSTNRYYKFNEAVFYGNKAKMQTSITQAGYATFCLPYNAVVPEGITAYTATDKDTYIELSPIGNGTIAAYEGVILKGQPGEYIFNATANEVTAIEGNQLVGVTKATSLSAADAAYMFTSDKTFQNIAFRLLNTNYTLGANKAYLKLTENSNAREFITAIWNENETGIEEIDNIKITHKDTIYSLSGIKLKHIQKGINIVNGKLVIK